MDRDALRPVSVKRRHLWVSDEVAEVLDGKRNVDGFPLGGDMIIQTFIAGYTVNISRKLTKRNKKDPEIHLEQIVGHDEVWALCVRRPRPGWRFFGRFLRRNHLALLIPFDKAAEGEIYTGPCMKVCELWERAFPAEPLFRGTELSDYLSEPYFDVDDPQNKS